MRIYRRNLPHWRQDGATYFVTFRLADSIPRSLVQDWQEEDRIWLGANGIEGLLSDPECLKIYEQLPEKARRAFERRYARRLHLELDHCQGACLLRRTDARQILVSALAHFHGDRWWVGDYVLMPNHIHGLFQPTKGYELEQVLASIKGYTSTQMTAKGIKQGPLWQDETYDRLVRDRAELGIWRRYMQANPGKAGLGEGVFTYHRCDWLDGGDSD